MDYNAEMRSSGDKDELSEKEKKNQKWYTVNRKKMILIAISNLIQSFFFFLEAITSRYAMLWNWTITEKLYGSIK